MTDENGLVYMRARYYSPDMRRFINADIVAGAISNAVTLNRFAYANGNPVSFVDPFGLVADDKDSSSSKSFREKLFDFLDEGLDAVGMNVSSQESLSGLFNALDCGNDVINSLDAIIEVLKSTFNLGNSLICQGLKHKIYNRVKPKQRDPGSWILENRKKFSKLDDWMNKTSKISKFCDEWISIPKAISKATKFLDNLPEWGLDIIFNAGAIVVDVGLSVGIDLIEEEKLDRTVTNAVVVAAVDLFGIGLSEVTDLLITKGVTFLVGKYLVPAGALGGSVTGPGGTVAGGAGGVAASLALGTVAGDFADAVVGTTYDLLTSTIMYEGKTAVEWAQEVTYDGYLWLRDKLFT